jgi:ribosomal protein L37AE/L43A
MVSREKLSRPKKSNVQLMFNTHDPLEEIQQAGRAQEDDYFRKLDQELLVALRAKSAAEIEQTIRQYTRMRCPKCGESLVEMPSLRAKIDVCPGCGGIWLDKGEWEGRVGSKATGWLQQVFNRLMASK